MPLPTPNLDDRRFQDFVDEAKRHIPHYCPEWTDHNVSDPGITLIELFSWITETLIYRLNRVPDKSYITFLNLMGVQLQEPAAASTWLTFWLSAPAADKVVIPVGTEAATEQTVSDAAVSFLTDNDLVILPPRIVACLTSPDGKTFAQQDWLHPIDDNGFPAFEDQPKQDNAFYLGFGQNPSHNIISLAVDSVIEGIGIRPSTPPVIWEAWTHSGWAEVELARDTTGGLNRRGEIVLFLPNMQAITLPGSGVPSDLPHCYWLRCRYTLEREQQDIYIATPQIRTVGAAAIGGMVGATNARTVTHELLGRSSGEPGQTFHLDHTPVLRLDPESERIEVAVQPDRWQPWTQCEFFSQSGPEDRHFRLDYVNGEVSFGPMIRTPDGRDRQFGAVPPRGAQIRFSRYRCGGGAAGNVAAHKITQLRSSVPYVDRVTNRRESSGGRDPEGLAHAKLRAPMELRTRYRAVTAEDYAFLAVQESHGVARAHCLQPRAYSPNSGIRPGTVMVLVVPNVLNPDGPLRPEQLRPSPEVLRDVRRSLDERRLLTTELQIGPPQYMWVRAEARLIPRPEAKAEVLRREALALLYRFLNPITGGVEGTGWPFERDLYVAEVQALLQQLPGLAYVEQVRLFVGTDSDQPVDRVVRLPPNGMIASGEHAVTIV
ncbi:MAG: putative baseplate assembly protein [Roseiflexaceae bacterium]